jgi:hypothetical protein
MAGGTAYRDLLRPNTARTGRPAASRLVLTVSRMSFLIECRAITDLPYSLLYHSSVIMLHRPFVEVS